MSGASNDLLHTARAKESRTGNNGCRKRRSPFTVDAASISLFFARLYGVSLSLELSRSPIFK